MANEVLGTIDCDRCKGRPSVHQTKRGKGRYLYTNGCKCKCDQTLSPERQTRLWNETEWRNLSESGSPVFSDGSEVVQPPNVTTDGTSSDAVQEQKIEPEKVEETTVQKIAEEPEFSGSEKSGGTGWLLGLAGAIATVAVLVLRGGS